ncbi:MAG: YggS family pyridoxal phosphate-dependent enzyme [Desulfosudaceae bacterium]
MKQALSEITGRIRSAATSVGRDPGEIILVAVSKTRPAATVARGIAAGISHLGENYIQEAREKIKTLSGEPVTWHFIGHLQSNKAGYAVDLFEWIHSLDSLKLARALDREAAKRGLVQKVLIQVNLGEEESKSGVAGEKTAELAAAAGELEHLSVRGLMTLPPLYNDPERVRPYFAALRRLRDDIRARSLPGVDMSELSMGMTGDFEVAIAEGATMVRVGTAVFGGR